MAHWSLCRERRDRTARGRRAGVKVFFSSGMVDDRRAEVGLTGTRPRVVHTM